MRGARGGTLVQDAHPDRQGAPGIAGAIIEGWNRSQECTHGPDA
jgi:hypothetical protein